jgi:hypothetical protein
MFNGGYHMTTQSEAQGATTSRWQLEPDHALKEHGLWLSQ